MQSLELLSVNISSDKGTVKRPVESATLDQQGVRGDAHAGPWQRQVSLLGWETIEAFAAELGRAIQPGEFAENLTVRGLDSDAVAPLDRIELGGVELEVTQIGKACHGEGCSVFREVGRCVMPRRGLFARVVRGGDLRAGMQGRFQARPFRTLVVTLSDRAAAGVYADRSGPRILELLRQFFSGRRWHPQFDACLLPDDPERLKARLQQAIAEGDDLVFTTGGTGVGPRDSTPEVVGSLCDKLLPGVVEHIRTKFGTDHPAARLSRSMAGVSGQTQLYALPGSVRAVEEYLGEILATVEHVFSMLHGLDVHA